MQTPITLTIGTAGTTVPRSVSDQHGHVRSFDAATFVKVTADVPTLNAGTHTWASSRDGGSTWQTLRGFVALTGYEPTNPTAATDTGGYRVMLGLFLPDTMIRCTSSVAQTATPKLYIGR